MKKQILLLLLFLFVAEGVCPQLRRAMLVDMKKERARIYDGGVPGQKYRCREKTHLPDTVYGISIKKQHGWYAPLKTVSEETARHHALVYRFTERNAKGRWCKMETVNGRGAYVPSGLSPYILNIYASDSDLSADAKWVETLKTTCVFELVPDQSGVNLIQERALDKDGNIVYLFSRTPIGPDKEGREQYVGSYKDCYGLPAEMRNDPGYTYGTLVMITEDEWGNDRMVEYMDASGVIKLNSAGVAAECYVYDAEGRVLRKELRDANGMLAADNTGNCGCEYSWAGYDMTAVTYMDTEWKPMRTYSARISDVNGGVVRINRRHDSYGRTAELFYTSADGIVPDCNASGIHKIAYTYNAYGDVAAIRFYDTEMRPINNRHTGIAVVKMEYDTVGRLTELLNLDKDENPAVTELYPSRKRNVYGENGELVRIEEYSAHTGLEELVYKYEKSDDRIYEMLGDGTYEIDSLDARGRLVSVAYYDYDGSRRTSLAGWAERTVEYDDCAGKTVQTGVYLDSDGEPVNVGDTGAKHVKETDSLSCMSKSYYYDKRGNLIETVATVFDTAFAKVESIYDINGFGVPCRSGGYKGLRWYRADAMYSCKDEFSSFMGRDEFGERDYIDVASGPLYYYQRISAKGHNKYYDENNDVIADFNMLRDELPKVMSVEVTDSAAYAAGIKDNDVILVYGDYAADFAEIPTLDDFMSEWAMCSAFGAGKERRMVVFRVDPATLEYGLVEIPSLKGQDSELGFTAHVRYLTKKQKTRIEEAIDENIKSDAPLVAWGDFDKGCVYAGDNPVVIAFPETVRNARYMPFRQMVPSPAILLASRVKDKDMAWRYGMDLEAFSDIQAFKKLKTAVYVACDYLFTCDMKNTAAFEQKRESVDAVWLYCRVNDHIYRQILKLGKKAEKMHWGKYRGK